MNGGTPITVCYFGAYDPAYQRNAVLRKGLAQNGMRVVECRVPPEWPSWRRAVGLIGRFKALWREVDVILLAELNQTVAPVAYILARLTRKPLVFDPFFSYYDALVRDRETLAENSLRARLFFLADRLSLMLADTVLADTLAHADYYASAFGTKRKRVHAVYVGADDDFFRPAVTAPDDDLAGPFRAVFVGSFIPLHGVEYIVEAARILSREPGIVFELVGEGQTFRHIRERVTGLGLRNVRLLGRRSFEELPSILSAASVSLGIFGVTEKSARVIPHKVFQSLAMRKCVVTGDSPAIREVFQHDRELYLCSRGDGEALAEAIRILRDDPERRRRLAESGYLAFCRRFTPRAIGANLSAIIGNVYSKGLAAAGRVNVGGSST